MGKDSTLLNCTVQSPAIQILNHRLLLTVKEVAIIKDR